MISTPFYRILRDALSAMNADQVAQVLDLVAKDREFVSTCKSKGKEYYSMTFIEQVLRD